MSDLPELLEAVTTRMVETINDLMAESGGEPFGLGDLRPLAADLIDYTLNREFGDIDLLTEAMESKPASSGWCDDPNCRICRKEAAMWPKIGQCAECPYKLNGVFAQTGCPNCPNRQPA